MLQKVRATGSVNFVNSFLSQESLFIVEALENVELMVINYKDLFEMSFEDYHIRDTLDKIKSKFELTGYKYDFYIEHYPPKINFVSNKSIASRSKCSTSSQRVPLPKFVKKPTSGRLQVKRETTVKNSLHIDFLSKGGSDYSLKYPLWTKFLQRISKVNLILKLREAWSLFSIVDIYYTQRMTNNILKSQNDQVSPSWQIYVVAIKWFYLFSIAPNSLQAQQNHKSIEFKV